MVTGLEQLTREKRLRLAVVQPQEQKAPGRHFCALSVLKREPIRKIGTVVLGGLIVTAQGVMVLK